MVAMNCFGRDMLAARSEADACDESLSIVGSLMYWL